MLLTGWIDISINELYVRNCFCLENLSMEYSQAKKMRFFPSLYRRQESSIWREKKKGSVVDDITRNAFFFFSSFFIWPVLIGYKKFCFNHVTHFKLDTLFNRRRRKTLSHVHAGRYRTECHVCQSISSSEETRSRQFWNGVFSSWYQIQTWKVDRLESFERENVGMFCRKALKAIFIEDTSPNESIDAEHEVAILVRLRHPNIVRFYDSFIDTSYFCIVTEYCEVNSSIWFHLKTHACIVGWRSRSIFEISS